VADLDAQRADGVVDDLGLVGAEEDEVTVLGARALEDLGDGCIVQVLDDGRLQAVTAYSPDCPYETAESCKHTGK